MPIANPIIETYSRLAGQYDDDANLQSCWGRAASNALSHLSIKKDCQVIVDVGCGTGRALLFLAAGDRSERQFIGVEPAENMRERAIERTRSQANVRILEGRFEEIPLESGSVDYLYSILAFHWTTDLNASVGEISRVLKPGGEMDLFFIGRNNGREFIYRTTPIFLKYMGPARLLESARLRKQLTKDEAFRLFAEVFDGSRLSIEESYDTYYDTLEGHWSWWVRIEGHFVQIPPKARQKCNAELKTAIQGLGEARGIPYTIHQLHLKLRNA
jgi:ubiquinone/menaquinone biosynthesis C-methylase UbiE